HECDDLTVRHERRLMHLRVVSEQLPAPPVANQQLAIHEVVATDFVAAQERIEPCPSRPSTCCSRFVSTECDWGRELGWETAEPHRARVPDRHRVGLLARCREVERGRDSIHADPGRPNPSGLEHRQLERHGAGGAPMRTAVDSEGGSGSFLALYAARADQTADCKKRTLPMSKLASIVFLLHRMGIGLGAFGHGTSVRHLHAAIDQFPIDADMHSILCVVWYFVGGCARDS